ncbi:MAG TPA: CocE/NonD family hydrolase [Fimbriimonadaceae bacterium]|nr:CocE/NonD family hydrolase [Fimbriimonadaceae bacterium]
MILLASSFISFALAVGGAPQRGGSSAAAQHYTKYEYMIPMRDGVSLYTSVYVPKDVPGKHPILMERTPYSAGPYGATVFRGVPTQGKWHDAGYIFAWQDVRGKYMSEGDFVDIRPQLPAKHGPKDVDESTDTWDTVDYLVKNVPDNDGHVGMRGISYPGFYAEIGTVHTHPALVAASPQAPVSEWFMGDDWHHNGCMFIQDAFDFMQFFGVVRSKPGANTPGLQVNKGGKSAYDFFLETGAMPNFDKLYYKGRIPYWNEVLSHETLDDWWKARSVPSKLTDIHCALLFVGGLFDAEDCYGALNSFAASKRQNPGIHDFLCMGPWFHGMWARAGGQSLGDLNFGMPTSTWFQDNVEFPFFEKYLRMQTKLADPSVATFFETGTNSWQTFPEWPPKDAAKGAVYLGEGKSVVTKPDRDGSDSYVNDPAHPTPYIEDLNSTRRPLTYPLADQRFAEKRDDVLTFKSEPLGSDVTWAGPITVDLWIKCSSTDCDLVAKVIDVYPPDAPEKKLDGDSLANEEILVRGDIMRSKFRDSFSNPAPLAPDKPARVRFKMDDVLHTFKKGHRLMIQIQSDWFPLVQRNPNVFTDINTAPDSAYQKATITVLHGKKYPSAVWFGQLPQVPGITTGR